MLLKLYQIEKVFAKRNKKAASQTTAALLLKPNRYCKATGEAEQGSASPVVAKALTIDKMHRSNQIVKICTSFAHPSFGRIQFQKATHTDYGKLKPHPN